MMTVHVPRARLCWVLVLAFLAAVSRAAEPGSIEPPANAPAEVEWKAEEGRLSLRYHGAVILDAKVAAEDAAGRKVQDVAVRLQQTETPGEKMEQRLKFVPAQP